MAALCLLVARICSLHSQPNPTAAPGPSASVVSAAVEIILIQLSSLNHPGFLHVMEEIAEPKQRAAETK
jgi:hypothetical protein